MVPKAWSRAVVVPLHKKGDQLECENYRGISLLSVPGKVFTQVILGRLVRAVHHQLRSKAVSGEGVAVRTKFLR